MHVSYTKRKGHWVLWRLMWQGVATLSLGRRVVLLLGVALPTAHAHSDRALTGRVIDPASRAVPAAEIRTVTSNSEGIFEIRAGSQIRFPTGESGSPRQIQFGIKLIL